MTRVALVGQPNCGKSTLFNMLTGARQHVANYPGVTVDIKKGAFKHNGQTYEVIDLPGVYSLTSYSNEEMVTRDYLLSGKADLVINVLDSSNLKQSLYLTVQMIEMGLPLILALNMADVAKGRGIVVDKDQLSKILDLPVVETVGNKLRGKNELLKALDEQQQRVSSKDAVVYTELSEVINQLTHQIEGLRQDQPLGFPARWGAIKLLENDKAVIEKLQQYGDDGQKVLDHATAAQNGFVAETDDTTANEIGVQRHMAINSLLQTVQTKTKTGPSLTDRIDRVVVNRFIGPLILLGVIYLLYYLSIDRGYKLSGYFQPWLSRIEFYMGIILPQGGVLEEGLLRSLLLNVTLAINSVLTYIPIFLILFACVAFMEDAGYMPRIAFILDRMLRRFGLQGQSTLPLILGGVFVGGCAVPGVMATRVIADERARLATILVVPMLNCQAKIPLYTMLIAAFFSKQSAGMMVFLSTITLLMALCAAKVLTLTVLRGQPSAPFIMELPPYHVPTIRGVVIRAYERTWIFVKKIGTVVAAVTVAIFFLTHYPSLNAEVKAQYQQKMDAEVAKFRKGIEGTRFAALAADEAGMKNLIDAQERVRKASFAGIGKEDAMFYIPDSNPFKDVVNPHMKKDKDVKAVTKAWRKFFSARASLLKSMNDDLLDNSVLGRVGKFIEPVTKYAGFSWKVNVSLLAALAAKESTVATLGMLYSSPGGNSGEISTGLQDQEGYTPLHALALMIFMALYPPCLATLIMVKMEAGGWKWPLLSLLFPIVLGLTFSSLIYTGGRYLGLTGIQATIGFSIMVVIFTVVLAMIKPKNELLVRRD